MNFSWLPLLGGGLATAATMAVGVNLTDLANAFAPAPKPEPITVYVEQPVVEVAPTNTPGEAAMLPPLIIAVLPAPIPTTAAVTSSTTVETPSYDPPVATPQPPVATPPPPPPPSSGYDDDDDGYDDDGDDD